jgi:hypothetical protein
MSSKQMLMIVLIGTLVLIGLLPAMAQSGGPPLPGELILDGLGAPRGLAFDADGNLIVADAGTGGDLGLTLTGPDGDAPINAGMSGRIVSLAPDGTVADLIFGIPSYASPLETTGIHRAIPNGDSLWLVSAGHAGENVGAYWVDSVVELDAETLAVKTVLNLNNFEATEDPDGNGYETNTTDIAWGADGTLYIVDAAGNSVISWTEEDGLALVAAWTDNPVPTSVEVAENGDIYIGFLGEGLAFGAGKIEHWSDGELVETFEGLNTVTDILLDGDTLYAVQMLVLSEAGPGPGSVVTVSADGVTVIAEGLPAPYGITKGPDGALYVTIGTLALEPGIPIGVLRLDM